MQVGSGLVSPRAAARPTTGTIVLLTRLARAVYLRSSVDLVGMNLRNMVVLAYLRDHPGASQQAMTEQLSMDSNTGVLVLNDLEDLEYVERRRDPADRRRHLVDITDAGLEALEEAELAQGSIEDEILSGLSESERAEFRASAGEGARGSRSSAESLSLSVLATTDKPDRGTTPNCGQATRDAELRDSTMRPRPRSRRGGERAGSCSRPRGTEEIDALLRTWGDLPERRGAPGRPRGRVRAVEGPPEEPEEAFVWPDEGPGFRPAQQRWMAAFPFPGTGALNRICVHPSIVDFAERALGNDDIRLYQAHASAKYAGVTNYEQPMHLDRNHSWLPAGERVALVEPARGSSTSPTSPRTTIPRAWSRCGTPSTSTTPTASSCPGASPSLCRRAAAPPGSGAPTWPTGRTRTTAARRSAPAPAPASWPPSPSSTP